MTHKEWERVGAGAGIVGVATLLVGFFLPGTLDADATAAQTKAFLVDNRDQILGQAVLVGFAMLLFLGFLATLRNVLRRTEDGTGELSAIMSGAALVLVALILAGCSILAGYAYRSAAVADAATARAVFDVSSAIFLFVGIPAAVFAACAAVLMRRSEVFAGWVPGLGWLAALANVGTPFALFATKGAWSPVGVMATAVPAMVFFAFVVCTAAVLVRHPEAGEARMPSMAMPTPA